MVGANPADGGGCGRQVRNQGMIATGNHLRFMIRCALQHAPTFADGHGGHPERDVEGAVPYEGGANPGDRGRCEPGEWGEIAGGRLPPLRGGANPEDRGRCGAYPQCSNLPPLLP